jgi:PAS domain S-box-containing protein
MKKESLQTFTSLADILSAGSLCEYLVLENKSSIGYSICGSSSNLYHLITKNDCFISINEVFAESSLNQLVSLSASGSHEVWNIKFCHNDFSRFEGIIYFLSKETVLLLISEKKFWSCLNNPIIETLLVHIRCFFYCINLNKLTIDFISTSIEKLLNYKVDLFTGKPVDILLNLIHPDFLSGIQKNIKTESIYKNVLTPTVNYFIKDNDNNTHFINQKQVYIGVDNQYTGLFCYAQELEGPLLDESNQKYIDYLTFMLESTNQGIWEYDVSSHKILYDIPLENLFIGTKQGIEIQYDNFLELIHPDDNERVQSEFNAFIDSDTEILSLIFQCILESDSWRWIELKAKKADYNSKGELQKIIGVYSDISAKKQVELSSIQKSSELEEVYLKLKANEEVFRQLVENTNDVFMLRGENNYIYINNQFEKIWGRDIFELMENPYKIADWIHQDDLKNVEVWVGFNQLISDKPLIEQYRIIKPDNTVRWLWTRTYPVFNDANKLYRIVSISTDITDQKDFEDALLSAKEKALESDLLKSNFLANISHEIRTPMNGIVGFAELITREDIDSQTRQNYVGIMKKSSEQLIRIIDDIIDFAKIEANQIRISPVKFNLNTLIDDLAAIFNRQLAAAEKNKIALIENKDRDDSEAVIISDDYRIRQILSNLLDNAVKFSNEGEIHFGYLIKDEKVEFFVKDPGIGIAPDKQKLIFERFRQADEGHTRKYGGTGLGLPISRGLVNILGGSIWMESIKNRGSNFYFTIPYKTEMKTSTSEKDTGKIVNRYNWKDKIFLVAEDDDMNFEYLRIILENSEAKIIRASDGSQAAKMCSKLNFDLILMDIRLPVMNGLEATRHIREMGIKTPIIAQTAFAMNDDVKNCIEAGCNRYIAKPITMDALYTLIEGLLQ